MKLVQNVRVGQGIAEAALVGSTLSSIGYAWMTKSIAYAARTSTSTSNTLAPLRSGTTKWAIRTRLAPTPAGTNSTSSSAYTNLSGSRAATQIAIKAIGKRTRYGTRRWIPSTAIISITMCKVRAFLQHWGSSVEWEACTNASLSKKISHTS
eukprot:2484975-Amphidinium_carterae.1